MSVSATQRLKYFKIRFKHIKLVLNLDFSLPLFDPALDICKPTLSISYAMLGYIIYLVY